jgi:hypothetical protein
MGKKSFFGGVNFQQSPESGAGDPLLTRDSTTGDVGQVTSSVTALSDGQIFVGNVSNVPTGVAVTGVLAITNTGVTSFSAGAIVNADINASANIALSKLATVTASRALVSNGSGVITSSSVTATEVGHLSGVSSAIQTQLNAKQATITGGASTIVTSNLTANRALIANGSGKVEASSVTSTEIGYVSGVTSAIQTQINTKLSVTLASPTDGDILYRTGGVWTNLAIGSNGQVLTLDSGLPSWQNGTSNGIPSGGTANQYLNKVDGTDYNVQWSDLTISQVTDINASADDINILQGADSAGVTAAEISYLAGVSSDIQTQIDGKLTNSLAQNAVFVGNASNVPSQLAAGSNGQVLSIVGGVPQWQTITGTGTVTSVALSGGTTGLSVSGSPITTSGTITLSGTLVAANGGTGQSSYTTGDILYASGATALSKLSVGSDGDVLTLAAGVPTWAAPSGGGTGTVTSVSGTSNRITITGTPTVAPVVDIAATYVGQASITTLGTIATGTWQATAIGTTYGGTGLTALGTANQLLRVNAGATALEYFTPTFISANQTITLSGDVTGSGTTSITTTIATNIVDDGKLRQSAGLSLIGRSTNTTGNVADITAGTDNQVLRRSGTSIAFGAVNLASSDAVTGILPIANGGTGVSTGVWALSSISILGGTATITSNARNQHIFNGTWTSSANNDYHLQITPSITADANSRTINAVNIEPTMATGGFTNTVLNAFRVRGKTLIKGLSTTGNSNTFTVTDSADATLLDVGDDGILRIGNNGSRPGISTASGTSQNKNGSALWYSAAPSSGGNVFTGTFSAASGTSNLIQVVNTFSGTGTTTNTILNVIPTYNATSTGETRLLDYNPTVTALGGAHYGIMIRTSAALNGFGLGVLVTDVPTAVIDVAASTTSRASLRIRSGVAPTSPNDGDVWQDGSDLKIRIGGVTKTFTLI